MGFWPVRGLGGPAVAVNAGAVFGPLGLGWHYICDIPGGLAITAVAWAVVRGTESWWADQRPP